jgi:phospholipid/cholesterol/gamma-HCH transport system permease protein
MIPKSGTLSKRIITTFEGFGSFCVFAFDTFRWTFRKPLRPVLVFEQAEYIGVDSVPIIALSSLSIGMIFSLQITDLLAIFRAEIMVGSAVAMTLGRELAPVFTSIMLVAKNGSAMAAEIGTMRVSEQIDAMETMSVNPIQYLVVPRVIGAVIVFPVLTALSNVVGVAGSYIVSIYMKGVDSAGYLEQIYRFVNPVDIWSGFIKAAVMGGLVSLICCYYGYTTTGGSKGVGEASTKAVVTASVAVLIADYIMSDIMLKVLF